MTRPERPYGPAMAMLAFAAGCTSPTTHVLVGNPFDPSGECLLPSTGFDLVDGPQPSNDCPPTCVVDAKTGTTYVTVTCPPYPPLDTIELQDASTDGGDAADLCLPALTAWASRAACDLRGGDAATGEAGD